MKNTRKSNSYTENSEYAAARAKWAREQEELFLNTFKKIGQSAGVSITPMQYVRAYKLCIEDYKFEYPAEYKITELIATEETYEQILDVMMELMKRFRLEFINTRKKQLSQRRKAAGRKTA